MVNDLSMSRTHSLTFCSELPFQLHRMHTGQAPQTQPSTSTSESTESVSRLHRTGTSIIINNNNNKNTTTRKPGVVGHACNSRTWEAEEGLPRVGGQPGWHSEFWFSLDYQMWPRPFFFFFFFQQCHRWARGSEHGMVTVLNNGNLFNKSFNKNTKMKTRVVTKAADLTAPSPVFPTYCLLR